ncbi:MAG: rRNA methyltransferase [Verrucomicrobiaceae bacterium]|nr:rRNA methyltransferase [Verrucomicrobiaceae bacterium]
MNSTATTDVSYREQLQSGIDALQLTLPSSAVEQLLQYLALLQKWNRAYNLTAVRDPAEMIARHFLDSLAIVPFIRGERFADVGTGAGLPGIPLAIAFPDKQFDLIDSNGKKIRFVTQAIAELQLSNVRAIQGRVETLQPQQKYAAVLSRAFASLHDMADGCAHLLDTDGVLLALKGTLPDDELQALPAHYRVDACHALNVPGVVGQRHLIEIRPQQ